MRRRLFLFATVVALCVVFAVALISCANVPAEFSEPDLAKSATITVKEDGNYTYIVDFGKETAFNTVVLSEKKDKVEQFKMYKRSEGGDWEFFYEQDRIDQYRVCAFEDIKAEELKIEFTKTQGKTKLDKVEVYNVGKKDAPFRVTNYMTTGGTSLEDRADDIRNYLKITTDLILIGEISVNADGKIVYGEGEQDFAENIALLNKLIAESEPIRGKKANITVSIEVKQNKDNELTKDFINDKLGVITDNIRDFTEKYNIAGVDYDWEYPENLFQWNAYSKLVVETDKKISPLGKWVSVALAPWGSGFSPEAVKAIEYVNVMAYDLMQDDARRDHASIYNTGKRAVDQMINNGGFKKEQILLGLSFYGRTTNGSGDAWPDYNWDYTKNGASLGKFGNQIKDFEYFDTVTNTTKTCDAFQNGYAMNRDKTAYAIASGIGGIMIFRAKCDSTYDYEYSLHRAVEAAISQRLK